MISIITPSYNSEHFIESCIKNIIAQNCKEMEHIIIDGGSKDGTVDLIKQYANQYSHIRWISESDQGQSDALNKGITLAKGKIIGILNVDDFYEPDILNRIVEIFKTLPQPTFLVGNCNILGNDGHLKYINKPKNIALFKLLLGPDAYEFPYNPSAYFYHASLHQKIGFYDVADHYTMDLDFILRVVQSSTVKYVDQVWGNFCEIEGSKTFEDKSRGLATKRRKETLKKYEKDLDFFSGIYLKFRVRIEDFRSLARRIKYLPQINNLFDSPYQK